MDDLKDIDPQIVEAVLANTDAYLEAQRRVQEIINAAQHKAATVERNLANKVAAGVSEDAAFEEYCEANRAIRMETDQLLTALRQEYELKYPVADVE